MIFPINEHAAIFRLSKTENHRKTVKDLNAKMRHNVQILQLVS